MNINLTLIGQMIAFVCFVMFCMKYVWPPILAAMAEREKKMADGLAAADRARRGHPDRPPRRVPARGPAAGRRRGASTAGAGPPGSGLAAAGTDYRNFGPEGTARRGCALMLGPPVPSPTGLCALPAGYGLRLCVP